MRRCADSFKTSWNHLSPYLEIRTSYANKIKVKYHMSFINKTIFFSQVRAIPQHGSIKVKNHR